MGINNGAVRKYWKQYQWSNVFALIRNNAAKPTLCRDRFENRLVVITGTTSGIGYAASRKYASMGANILSINRSEEKSITLCNEIKQDFGVDCDYKIADLSSLKEIHRVGKELEEMDGDIDVLIHNAGVYLNKRRVSKDGLEMTFAVNYFSSFILNHLLKDKLIRQEKSRIIMINSEGYRFAAWGIRLDDMNWEKRRYTGLGAYGSSKIAQILSMRILDEYFTGSGVTINAMHPGAVTTSTGNGNGPVYKFFKKQIIDRISQSPEISAEALYTLGVSRDVEGISGTFFNLTRQEELTPPALDREAARELWKISLKMGGWL